LRNRKYIVSGDNFSNSAWSKGASLGWIARIVTIVPSLIITFSIYPASFSAVGFPGLLMIFQFLYWID
jgi:hypothetical protein